MFHYQTNIPAQKYLTFGNVSANNLYTGTGTNSASVFNTYNNNQSAVVAPGQLSVLKLLAEKIADKFKSVMGYETSASSETKETQTDPSKQNAQESQESDNTQSTEETDETQSTTASSNTGTENGQTTDETAEMSEEERLKLQQSQQTEQV